MCILLLALRCVRDQPLLLLANRDELRARATATAAPWVEDADCVGGRDLHAGGTWLAQHGNGRFAAVTNQRTGLPATAPCSRGALVTGFVLGQLSAEDFLGRVMADAENYAPFNLLLGDRHAVWLLDGNRLELQRLESGVHVISNGGTATQWPKTRRLQQRFQALEAGGKAVPGQLLDLLMDDRQPADAELPDTGVGLALERMLAPVFIRGERYGTRASTLLWHGADGAMELH
ncbi:MAG: NRDE family protein, partial [Dokdonella sp.]